jgi:hypothetical protein
VLALVGIVQKPLYSGAIYGIWELELGRMPFGPFVNRNHFAGWMIMVLPLTLALLSAGIDRSMRGLKPGWRYKVLWFSSPEASQLVLIAAAAVVMALSVMLTMSRSGITAFMLSLLVMGWFAVRALDDRSRRDCRCLPLAADARRRRLGGPGGARRRFTSGDWGEFSNRRGAWTDAWSVAQDFPAGGTGLNTYWAAALFYQRHELTHFFAQAHNDYMQLAAEGGAAADRPGPRLPRHLHPGRPPRDAGAARVDDLVAARRCRDLAAGHRVPGDGGVQPADAGQRRAVRRRVRDRAAQAAARVTPNLELATRAVARPWRLDAAA